MLKQLRSYIAELVAPDVFREYKDRLADEAKKTKEAELSANRRYAEYVAKMDPFEMILKKYNGIFSEEFEHPEERLDAPGRFRMMMWGYQQKTDPAFKHMIEWIMNSAGNETMKRAPISNERTQYGRAQIANMVLLRDEVGRLASLYEEELEKHKPQDFDTGVAVE